MNNLNQCSTQSPCFLSSGSLEAHSLAILTEQTDVDLLIYSTGYSKPNPFEVCDLL